MNEKLRHLVNLLDDDDEQSASFAMAELLTHEKGLEEVLQEIQESNNACLRRRGHQIQSIQSIRKRRSSLSARLKQKKLDLFNSLSELHFLWYDNDSADSIKKYWDQLLLAAEKYRPDNVEKLAYFMRKSAFTTSSREDLDADFLCLGIVLEDAVGVDFMLCAIAQQVAEQYNFSVKIIKITGDFALYDPATQSILLPQRDWHIFKLHRTEKFKVWSSEEILKLAATLLFYCAVSTDSFRYIYTIGKCLSSLCGKNNLDFLPYPLTTRLHK